MSAFVRVLVELRFWVATMVTLLSAAASAGLGLSPAPVAVAIVFFSALGVYNLDHVVDRERRFGAWPLRLTVLSTFALVALLVAAKGPLRVLVGSGLAAICLYFVPLKVSGRSLRLENLPGFKPLLVGGAVSVAAVTVPWFSTVAHGRTRPYPVETGVVLVSVLGALCASNALLFDIRDAELDRAAGVPTAPSVRGVAFTRRLASLGFSLSLVGSVVGALGAHTPTHLYLGTAAAALVLLGAAWLLPERTSRTVFSLVVDGALSIPWWFVAF